MFNRTNLREGMHVRSADGEKLGKIFALGDTELQIEKGLFFPKDYVVRYDDITGLDGDTAILRFRKDELTEYGEERRIGETTGIGAGLSPREEQRGSFASQREGDISVPLREEQLEAVKRDTEAGAVRIHKEVEVETKTLEVPIRKERVRVERVPASGATASASDEMTFREEDIVVPVREEEVEVTKRPVVREELRVSKEAWEEQKRVSGTVRKEQAEVRADADIETEGERVARGWNPEDDRKTRY